MQQLYHIIVQQAVHLAKQPGSRVGIIGDDVDVFAELVYIYSTENLTCPMIMESPITGRVCADIQGTAQKHPDIAKQILAIHGLTVADTVAATYGIGKKKAVAVFRKRFTLDKLWDMSGDIPAVIEQATKFMSACYGITNACTTMTDCRRRLWGQKMGKLTTAPKLCTLPPTTEAFELNVRRAHIHTGRPLVQRIKC